MKLQISDVKKIKYPKSNLTYEQVIKNEVHRFKDILQRHIEEYYKSYRPSVYVRGSADGNLLESLTVDDIVQVSANGKRLTCRVLINENAIHKSIMKQHQHLSNVFYLMNYGWQVNEDVPFSTVYRFGYFEGVHFLENSIKEFNSTNKYGITIESVSPLIYYG